MTPTSPHTHTSNQCKGTQISVGWSKSVSSRESTREALRNLELSKSFSMGHKTKSTDHKKTLDTANCTKAKNSGSLEDVPELPHPHLRPMYRIANKKLLHINTEEIR